MLTANHLNKTLPCSSRTAIPTGDVGDSAQSLRPTFDGWGPRL